MAQNQNSRPTVFDPLRKKEVPLTDEEKVRQWFIGVLLNVMKVPAVQMMSEYFFTLGGKKYRSDIFIWDRSARPLAAVECKKSDIDISEITLDQAVCYSIAMDLKWLFLTNGKKIVAFKKINGKFESQNELPSYEQMLG